jgi:hypothetical protein
MTANLSAQLPSWHQIHDVGDRRTGVEQRPGDLISLKGGAIRQRDTVA